MLNNRKHIGNNRGFNSSRFGIVDYLGGAAPQFTANPVITAPSFEVGQTLTCSDGTVTGTEPITYSYQWYRGVTLIGADQNTYPAVYDDVGENITCKRTATNAYGSASQVSNTVVILLTLQAVFNNHAGHNQWAAENSTVVSTTTTWIDYAGVHNVDNPAAANQPATNSPDTDFNNKKSATFTTDDYLRKDTVNYGAGQTTGGFWFVFKTPATAGTYILFGATSGSATRYFNIYLTATNKIAISMTNGTTAVAFETSSSFSLNKKYKLLIQSDGSKISIYLNNISIPVNVTSGVNSGQWLAYANVGNLLTNITIGARVITGSFLYYNGKIGMVGNYPLLSDVDRELMGNDLMSFYDIPKISRETIFTDTFDRGVLGGNYTSSGSPTLVMDGNNLVMSGGTGVLTKYVKYTAWNTCLEDWRLVLNFQATTKIVADEGIFVGIKSSAAFGNRSVHCQVAHGTGVNGGKSIIRAGTSAPDTFSDLITSTAQTINGLDEIRVTIIRSGLTIDFLTENLTTGTNRLISWNFPLSSSVTYQHNTGTPYIGTIGGTQTIRDWTFERIKQTNLKTVFIGDSLTHGLNASILTNRWANKVMEGSANTWEVNSGGGDYTENVLLKMDEIILLNPQYVVMQLGGNDVRFGVAAATQQANYTSITNQLVAAGINVIHLLTAPDNAYDMTTWNNWLTANYTTIDCFTPLKDGGTGLNATYDAGDGTHLNNAGHQLNADTLIASAPQIY